VTPEDDAKVVFTGAHRVLHIFHVTLEVNLLVDLVLLLIDILELLLEDPQVLCKVTHGSELTIGVQVTPYFGFATIPHFFCLIRRFSKEEIKLRVHLLLCLELAIRIGVNF
jgi:hypothetical protein